YEAGFDRLAEANFVREDAATFRDAPQGEDYGINLMRVRVDPAPPLGSQVPSLLIGATEPHEVLGQQSPFERVDTEAVLHCFFFVPAHLFSPNGTSSRSWRCAANEKAKNLDGGAPVPHRPVPCFGQSSVGSMTVMTGSPWSPGLHTALS